MVVVASAISEIASGHPEMRSAAQNAMNWTTQSAETIPRVIPRGMSDAASAPSGAPIATTGAAAYQLDQTSEGMPKALKATNL